MEDLNWTYLNLGLEPVISIFYLKILHIVLITPRKVDIWC